MSFYQDRQIRGYALFLLLFSALIWIVSFSGVAVWAQYTKEMRISNETAIASSLLEQGVPRDIIANALTSQSVNEAGKELLNMLGVEKQDKNGSMFYAAVVTNAALMILLFAGTFIFQEKRRTLYLEAEKVLNHYINGDYSCHLPQNREGAIYQLFAVIERFATMLQAKNETERRTKEFLKSTVSDISHQLKTPLAALTLYQEIMEAEPDNAETVKEFSAKTGAACKRMEQLIQAMLKITRLDTGSIVFEKRLYQVSELILYSLSELHVRAKAEQKEIIIDGSPEDMILCDMEWTGEAIGNIVKNALDHTVSGGIIRISWEYSPMMLRIWICDNGRGIAPEDIHHIFKRFFRSKNSVDTQGIGLGLSLAKSIIDGQGGTISVQSNPNEGTTFILSFLTEL